MPDSTPHIQQIRVESQTLPVKERVEQTSARGDITVDPCGGISITVSLDRPNEEITVSAEDVRDDNASFVYKKEGGSYDSTQTYGPFPEGEEVFYVKEQNKDCIFKVTKEVVHCDITLNIDEVIDEEYGYSNGEIHVSVSTPSDSVEWAFDGGAWFSGSKTQKWTGLDDKTYLIEVRDEWGCKADKMVTVDNIPDVYAPSIPQNILIEDRSDGEASVISWDKSTDDETSISHYKVYRSQTSGFTPDSNSLLADNITSTSYEDTSVVDGTTYYYRVSAVDERSNESTASTEKEFLFTDDVVPQAPSSLSGTASDNTVDLDWNASASPDIDHYNVYRDFTKVAQVSGGTTTYSDTGLTNGTEYEYVITAVDEAGNESSNSNSIKKTPTDKTAPSDPTGLSGSFDTNNSEVNLTWDANTESDLDHYNIYRSTSSGGSYNKLGESTNESYTDSISSNEQDTNYFYVVEAIDDDDLDSGYSNEVEVSTTLSVSYNYDEPEDLTNQDWFGYKGFTEQVGTAVENGNLALFRRTEAFEEGVASSVGDWTTVNLDGSFTNPIVIVFGQQGADLSIDAETSRPIIRNKTSNSFEVKNIDSGNNIVQQDIGYMVFEAGHYTVDGVEVEAGTYTTSGDASGTTFNFTQQFGSSNIAFVDTLQEETTHAYSSRYIEGTITSSGVDTYWESFDESQGSNEDGGGFTAGYLAVRTDQTSNIIEAGLATGISQDPSNGNWYTVNFGNDYDDVGLFFSNPISEPGPDPTITGVRSIDANSAQMRATEGYTGDTEQGHATVKIPWIVVGKGYSGYLSEGHRTSPRLSLNEINEYDSSSIAWASTIPTDTDLRIATAIAGDPRNQTPAIDLSGGSSYANVGSVPVSDYLTVEGWINHNDEGANFQCIAGNTRDINNNDGWTFSVTYPDFKIKLQDGSSYRLGFNTTVPANEWHHVAAVFDGSKMKLYLDGDLDAEKTLSGKLVNNSAFDLNVGAMGYNPGSNNINGDLDEVRIWNIARTQSEIRDKKGEELSGTETGLVAYYNINEGSGTTLGDSANSYDATIQNSYTWIQRNDPLDWQYQTSGTEITNFVDGNDYSGNVLLIREAMTTTTKVETPELSDLQVTIDTVPPDTKSVSVPSLSIIGIPQGYIEVEVSSLIWQTVDEFRIYRATSQGGPYSQVKSYTDPGLFETYTDTNTTGGTTYYYVATIVRDGTESSYSSEVSETAPKGIIDIPTLSLTGRSVDTSEIGGGGYPISMKWGDGGYKFYELTSNAIVNQFEASEPYNIDTLSGTTKSHDVSSEDSNARGITFSDDGTKMFISGFGSNEVFEYDLGTAWDISTASYTGTSSQPSVADYLEDCHLVNNGKTMYIGNNEDEIIEWQLNTADTIADGYSEASFASGLGQPHGIYCQPDGKKVVFSQDGGDYWEFDMSTAFDISTMSAGDHAQPPDWGTISCFCANPSLTLKLIVDGSTGIIREYINT